MPTYSHWSILNHSIYKWVNLVIQYIPNTYQSLCVTCTILSKCCHTLFSSILVALFYTYVNLFKWAISKFYPCLCKAYIFFPLYLGGSFLSNHLTLPSKLLKSYLASHKPPTISFLPSIHKKAKNHKSTLSNCLHCLILFVLDWCVYVVLLYTL
jgi:hypothetical protein